MGLASALAAQGSGPPAAHQPPPQGQGWLGPSPAAPAAAHPYAAPTAAAPQYGTPVAPGGMLNVVAAKLSKIVAVNQLSAFYPPDRVQAVAARLAQSVDFNALAARWRMPVELAVDLSSLALYDIVIYADDSGSMESGDGERIEDLKVIVGKVAEVATLFDDDGIEVRFINSNVQGNNVKTAQDASRLLRSLEYRWDTKIGTQLEAKILTPMAYSRRLQKPLLIITVTDGEPTDKPADKIFTVIQDCISRMTRAGYGPHAVAFQFAQVGRDQEAQEFLARLDRHPQIGKMVDCTSYFELEQAEYASKGITLSVEAWLVKLMVGAIDPEYDEQDEGGPAPQQPGIYTQPGGYGVGPGPYPPAQHTGYPPAQPGYGQQQQQQQPGGGYPQPYLQQGSGYPPPQQQYGGFQPGQQPAAPPGYPGAHQQHKPQKQGFFGKLFG